jgi:NodT family efflux transporter outer membrane factor (OMF) lipoprotein
MRRALASLLALSLAACAAGPDFVRPDAKAPPAFAARGDAPPPADQAVAAAEPVADWWRAYHNPALDQVIDQALAANQDVAQASARLAEAREAVAAARAARLPQAALGATAGRQKYGAALFGPLDLSVPPFTYYTIGPSVTVPLDLAGGAKRTVEQRAAQAERRAHELDAARLTLAANVAAQALSLAAACDELAALDQILAEDQRNVDLIQRTIRAGTGTRTQLLAAQAQLASDRTLAPPLRQQEAAARHALAVLAGHAPGDWTPPDFALADFTLPGEIAASVPSELVRRRPDILAAEAELHAASAGIGVATANLYPHLDLTGAYSRQALDVGGLFDGGAGAWSLAANLTQPLFNGGRLKAERRAAVDRYQAALAAWRQTVLTAFGQVADRLQAIANDADQLRAQSQSAETAAAALDIARRSYAAGASGVLDVVDAERRLAQARIGASRAKAQRLIDTVQLQLALAGAPPAAPKG